MPWFIRFCFLTLPPVVGVAFTLAVPASDGSHNLTTVAVVGLAWLGAAYYLQRKLRESEHPKWVRRWILWCVVLPLVGLFAHSLRYDPATVALFDRHSTASVQQGPGELAPAAPHRHALTWGELGELLASVQPCAARFSQQLLTSVPPAWWLAAFVISVWKGK